MLDKPLSSSDQKGVVGSDPFKSSESDASSGVMRFFKRLPDGKWLETQGHAPF